MMVILFLAAVLFAIPTAGVSLIAFFAVFFGKKYLETQSRLNDANRREATRELDHGTIGNKPSWIDTSEEAVFFDGVTRLANRQAVPLSYVVSGFTSPDSSSVLYALAANMEAKGSSFISQQIATANFIAEAWGDLDSSDQQIFRIMDVNGKARAAR